MANAAKSKKRPSEFASPAALATALENANYFPSPQLATSTYLACAMARPLLVEGPAGTGKTALASALAAATGRPLIRLSCYEGIDESRALYEWEYAKQLLYTQILRDRIDAFLSESDDDTPELSLEDALDRLDQKRTLFFSERFLLARPLLQALTADEPVVLLIDEVDKSDPEFEAFLLELLADFTVTIPELGPIRAKHTPHVVLTSNRSRELSDPLRRRCLHLTLDFPSAEREVEILQAQVQDIDAKLARTLTAAAQHMRTLDLRKVPSISEVIDWARALVLLGHDTLSEAALTETLSTLTKHAADAERLRSRTKDIVQAAQIGQAPSH